MVDGETRVACTRYPDNLELTLQIDPVTLDLTLVGPYPVFASFVPANPGQYQYSKRLNSTDFVYDSQVATSEGGLFYARGVEEPWMGDIYYRAADGSETKIADATYLNSAKVMWSTEP